MSSLSEREKQPYLESAEDIQKKILAIIVPILKEYNFIELETTLTKIEDTDTGYVTTSDGREYDVETDIYLGLFPMFKVYVNKFTVLTLTIENISLDDQVLKLNFEIDYENAVTTDIPAKKHDMGLFKSILNESMKSVLKEIGSRFLKGDLNPETTQTWDNLPDELQ